MQDQFVFKMGGHFPYHPITIPFRDFQLIADIRGGFTVPFCFNPGPCSGHCHFRRGIRHFLGLDTRLEITSPIQPQ